MPKFFSFFSDAPPAPAKLFMGGPLNIPPAVTFIPNESVTIFDKEPIGFGTFGKIYSGKMGNIDIAIKVLRCQKDLSQERKEKFKIRLEREIELLSLMNHPNVIKFFGILDKDDDNIYLVTELCRQGNLWCRLSGSNELLDYDQRLSICLGIAEGMEYIQTIDPQIMHRDLKSPNIFLDEKDNMLIPKIGDFGLSRYDTEDKYSLTYNVGTVGWMAPEVFFPHVPHEYTAKCDVYSFGIVMLEIFESPRRLFSGMKKEDFIKNLQHGVKSLPMSKMLPEEIRKLVEQCCNEDPGVRPSFTSITQKLKQLQKQITEQSRTLCESSLQ